MKIGDALIHNPKTTPLANQGQARIGDRDNEKAVEELKAELKSFVCEGLYSEGIQRMIESYLSNMTSTSQKAAWVSGFFGSGKSHLLKMLCHLWMDTKFADGSTARSLVPALPDELHSLLRELDTAGKRSGGLFSAAGSLPSGTTDKVRLTVLGVLLRAVGLPEGRPQANFCLWLHSHDLYEKFKNQIESTGKSFSNEVNNLYVSPLIAKTLMECWPEFGKSEADVRSTLKAQFPNSTSDLTSAEFLKTFKDVLALKGKDGKLPCTVLILDEVQQYIGDSAERSTLVAEVAETITKQMDGKVLLVASGQNALSAGGLFQKLLDRFIIPVPLSDADVENVTRKVLLQKKSTSHAPLKAILDSCGGEISRQIQGTKIAETPNDREFLIADYPLLPTRRRLWEHFFRHIDITNSRSQLRSQLRIVHDAVAEIADREIGFVVPADKLFEALAADLVTSGVLLREINERIQSLPKDPHIKNNQLAKRMCGLIFLIGRLPRNQGVDIGVRSSADHLTDLMIEDLNSDRGRLREEITVTLAQLETQGTLMKIGDEYRLQTKEGADWDREFRNRQDRLVNDDATIHSKRDELLRSALESELAKIRVPHGASKTSRKTRISWEQVPPPVDSEQIILWVRDEWSASSKQTLDQLRALGSDSSIIGAFIPKKSAEDLKRFIVDAVAAQETIDFKSGAPTNEGLEAKRAIESKREIAISDRDKLIQEIIATVKIYLGGGTEIQNPVLADRIREAVNTALARQFPRFSEADSAAWDAVIKRSKEGSDQPLQPLGYAGPVDQHPVARQIISVIGSGKIGSEIRRELESSPFGWPKDAIDGMLLVLCSSQFLTAILNGAPVQVGQLDQTKISKTEFRVERITLTTTDRIKVRQLYQVIGLNCKAGDEVAKSEEFIRAYLALANKIGGPAPLPAPPDLKNISEVQLRTGNDRLAFMRDSFEEFKSLIESWQTLEKRKNERELGWNSIKELLRHGQKLAEFGPIQEQINAVIESRLLLGATDPVPTIKQKAVDTLRKALVDVDTKHRSKMDAVLTELRSNSLWMRLSDQQMNDVLRDKSLNQPASLSLTSDVEILGALDNSNLEARILSIDAIEARKSRAIDQIARILEPKSRRFNVASTTLSSETDVDKWLKEQKAEIMKALKDGPVIIG